MSVPLDDVPANPAAIELLGLSAIHKSYWRNYFASLRLSAGWCGTKSTVKTILLIAKLAWTNINGAVRQIRHRWAGMLRILSAIVDLTPNTEPIAVMVWAIERAKLSPAATILDLSWAAAPRGSLCNLGRKFIGIEIEPNTLK